MSTSVFLSNTKHGVKIDGDAHTDNLTGSLKFVPLDKKGLGKWSDAITLYLDEATIRLVAEHTAKLVAEFDTARNGENAE